MVLHVAQCAVLALSITSAQQADNSMFKGGVMIFLMQSAVALSRVLEGYMQLQQSSGHDGPTGLACRAVNVR